MNHIFPKSFICILIIVILPNLFCSNFYRVQWDIAWVLLKASDSTLLQDSIQYLLKTDYADYLKYGSSDSGIINVSFVSEYRNSNDFAMNNPTLHAFVFVHDTVALDTSIKWNNISFRKLSDDVFVDEDTMYIKLR